jgi:hypothetical protein
VQGRAQAAFAQGLGRLAEVARPVFVQVPGEEADLGIQALVQEAAEQAFGELERSGVDRTRD